MHLEVHDGEHSRGVPKIGAYALPTLQSCGEPRVQWMPDPSRGALLIHDMQNYFVRAFGEAGPIGVVVQNIVALVSACRDAGIPVVYSAQSASQSVEQRGLLSDFWGPGLVGDEEGAQIIAKLQPQAGDVVLTKWRYSAFVRTELEAFLRENNKRELYICGVYTHIGIQATACDGFMRDIRSFVVRDATADFSHEEQLGALRYIQSRCGVVKDSRELRESIESYGKKS